MTERPTAITMNRHHFMSLLRRVARSWRHVVLAGVIAVAASDATPLYGGPDDQVAVEALSGDVVTGSLSQWTSEGIEIATDDGIRRFDADELLGVRFDRREKMVSDSLDRRPIVLELVDGSRLRGTSYQAHDGRIIHGYSPESPVETDTSLTAAVLLIPLTGKAEEQWRDIRKLDATGDIVVVTRRGSLDYLEGIIDDVTSDHVRFRVDGDEMSISRSKVQGLVYYHSQPRKLGPSLASVLTSTGDRIEAQTIELAGETLRLVSRAGVTVTLPLATVAEADFSSGKRLYLSDLQHESFRWTPYYGLTNLSEAYRLAREPRKNESFTGELLRLDGVEYRKGLAVRSRTELVYRLPDGFRRFAATVGIDDRFGSRGNVQLSLFGDDNELFTATVHGDSRPLPLSIDITGVRRLKIVVDYGEDQDVADHLNICDARISK